MDKSLTAVVCAVDLPKPTQELKAKLRTLDNVSTPRATSAHPGSVDNGREANYPHPQYKRKIVLPPTELQRDTLTH